MKKILLLLALMSALLVSCEKPETETVEDNPEPTPDPEYSISISPTELTFGAAGGDQTVTVTSSEDWYLDGERDWCEVSTSYGNNGDKVTFKVKPYDNTEESRTATFTFYCGDKETELVVTQEAKEYSISVEPTELTFDVEGGEKEITITSSDNWYLSENPKWITVSERYGENGATITVSVEYNDETDIRSGDIVFSCGDKETKVTVTQQPDNSPIIQFKDRYFLDALLETYTVKWNNVTYNVDVDKNNDGQISEKEAASVEVLDLSMAVGQTRQGIRNADEFIYFTNLRCLLFDGYGSSSIVESLDLSKSSRLEFLRVMYLEKLTTLNVNGCTALTTLQCDENQLTSLDVSGCTALTELYCRSNQLMSLDVSDNTALTTLECYSNQLTSLDVSGCTALTSLDCAYNQLTSLDVSNSTALTGLGCFDNQLTSLDLSNNTALTRLVCGGNQLTSLDLSKNTALTYLDCGDNQFTTLDLSKNTALTYLACDGNQLTTLDLSKNTALTSLDCRDNPLTKLILYRYHILSDSELNKITKEYGEDIIEYAE